ncbi:MAG: hypothetical protein MJ102_04710 [Clostridia bacterium]|nr:hypothetical protein [Clostridia bacterium]
MSNILRFWHRKQTNFHYFCAKTANFIRRAGFAGVDHVSETPLSTLRSRNVFGRRIRVGGVSSLAFIHFSSLYKEKTVSCVFPKTEKMKKIEFAMASRACTLFRGHAPGVLRKFFPRVSPIRARRAGRACTCPGTPSPPEKGKTPTEHRRFLFSAPDGRCKKHRTDRAAAFVWCNVIKAGRACTLV